MFRLIHVTKVTKQLHHKTISRTIDVIRPAQRNKSVCSDRSKDHTEEPLDFSELKFVSKVPLVPHVSPINLAKVDRITIDDETIQLLERLSLVNVDSK